MQIEFHDIQGIFELFIDQSWVISKNDQVALAGYRDDTGKYCCYAYKNISKDVKGWNYNASVLTTYIVTGLFF